MTQEFQVLHIFIVKQLWSSYGVFQKLEEKGGTPEYMVPHFLDHLQVFSDLWVALLDKHRMDRKSLNQPLYCMRTLKFLSININYCHCKYSI